jgi:hypothetical protein
MQMSDSEQKKLNNKSCSSNEVQETIIAQEEQNKGLVMKQNLADVIKNATDNAKTQIANKTAGKSERKLLTEQIRKERKLIDTARENALEMVGDDELDILEVKNHYVLEYAKLKMSYKTEAKKLGVDLEILFPAFAQVGGEKIGKAIAPVTKSVQGFFGSLKRSAFNSK